MGALILLGIIAMAALGILAGLYLATVPILMLVAAIVCWFGFGTTSLDRPGGETNFFASIGIGVFTVFFCIGLLVSMIHAEWFGMFMESFRTFLFR